MTLVLGQGVVPAQTERWTAVLAKIAVVRVRTLPVTFGVAPTLRDPASLQHQDQVCALDGG